jgi:hypothetical protein
VTAMAGKESHCTIADQHLIWSYDPDDLLLEASTKKRDCNTLPEPLCAEIGRRLLLAELEFGDWVVRRVESVRFERERSVSRRVSAQFIVRPDAPILKLSDGRCMYLVPLSMMRRRTLVNFKLEDENGGRLPMLGLRVAQQLDESLLLAAAATVSMKSAADPKVREFIKDVIAGEAERVETSVDNFLKRPSEPLKFLTGKNLFNAVLNRLHRNFTLHVLLDVKEGTHRTLHMSFDEPTEWKYQRPELRELTGIPRGRRFETGLRVPIVMHFLVYMLAKLGLAPTRIRFQVPAAENTASYHFEATAPLGVRIVQASLLAGRPHEPTRRVSIDRIHGHTPTIGLHAVEIPNNSLCRVQLNLRVPSAGWLTHLVMSCLVIAGVLASVVLHSSELAKNQEQVTNVVVILITASAATATLVAQRDFHGLGASMVTHLRALGALSLALPIIAAGYLVYGISVDQPVAPPQRVLMILFAVSIILLVASALAWLLSWLAERNWKAQASPWDMTIQKKGIGGTEVQRRSKIPKNYDVALKKLKFRAPAVVVQSAEGWHEIYTWTDRHQEQAKKDLEALGQILTRPAGVVNCARLGTACSSKASSVPSALRHARPEADEGKGRFRCVALLISRYRDEAMAVSSQKAAVTRLPSVSVEAPRRGRLLQL